VSAAICRAANGTVAGSIGVAHADLPVPARTTNVTNPLAMALCMMRIPRESESKTAFREVMCLSRWDPLSSNYSQVRRKYLQILSRVAVLWGSARDFSIAFRCLFSQCKS
jgi:hypothetical protein